MGVTPTPSRNPMSTAEKYLNPKSSARSPGSTCAPSSSSRASSSGLHASPFQGFSVEFSEHRKYVPGDDLKDLDWNVYAKTDRYYVKKFQAETNVTGYLVMDLSALDGLHVSPGADQVRVRASAWPPPWAT